MRLPAFIKHKKHFKGRVSNNVAPIVPPFNLNGLFILRATEPGRLSAKQLEAARKSARRFLKKAGKIWLGIFAQTPVTAKPLEVRMGGGKGGVSYWAASVRPGCLVLTVSGASATASLRALKIAQRKLAVRTQIVVLPRPTLF